MERITKKFKEFISYWYLRYLLATEMYCVEPWERVVIHLVLALLFALFWMINSKMVGNAVEDLLATKPYMKAIS